jgi:ribose transport system substrate-binding protein
MTKNSMLARAKIVAAAPLLLTFVLICGGACNRTPAGAGSGGAATPAPSFVKLGFVTNNTSEFWKIAAAGIHKYEKEAKVQVDLKLPASGTAESQNQILQDLASQGYAGIAVSAIAPNDQVPLLDKIAEKTNLITFDSDAPKSKRLLYIGTDNYEAGKVLGGRIVTLLPKGGKIAVFVGTFAADNAAQRFKGIADVVAGHNIEIIDKREDNTDRAKARSNVEDLVNAHHDLALVVGLYNYNGPAIAAALEGLGKKGKVLAAVFDEDDGTLAGIESGAIQATVVQKPFMFGYLASKWMHELATKGEAAKAAIPPSHSIDTGVDLIDKSNVAGFKAKLAELKRS